MVEDLSRYSRPVGSMFRVPEAVEEWRQYALSEEQLNSYRREGYVAGIRLLSDEQVDVLREQLAPLFDPRHPGHELFHEYHSNESKDAKTVLFHALGAWRIAPAFHDILWNPAFTVPASQLRRRRRAVLARPALLQAASARRRRGLAPGLLVLDPHRAHGAPDLLHRPG